ncbi:MAG: DUF2961 domain-containing protein [Phycisphaerales bacterium]|nr:DUF2961 domain-containing protein [Phycisphaerales bacterium]
MRSRFFSGLAAIAVGFAGGIAPAQDTPAPPQTSAITTQSLLEELIDRDAIARFPSPAYTCKQFSSYDRASTTISNSETWFANADYNQYLRTEENNGRKEWVMMDVTGPGAIVRIWSANPKGNLRIYLDNKPEPVLEAPMKAILGGTGKIEAPLSGIYSNGCNLYLPIPYASHCKVTSDSGEFYYQINYRTYEEGTAIRSFQADDLEKLSPNISVVQSALTTPPRTANEPVMLYRGDLAPGASVTKKLPPGPSAINRLWLNVRAPNMDDALRNVIVRMGFDGEETVWCPAGDFFCSGVGFNSFDSWYTATKNTDQLISRWTMPYRQSGVVMIENLGTKPVSIELAHRSSNWDWDERSMHFHANWRQQRNIHTQPRTDWNYIEIKGKGVYVGDCLSILNPVPEWWGEGDEKIYVDGEAFPSHFGTGTEDYYGYAWSSPKKFQHAFHGQTRSDGEASNTTRGYSSVFRTRSLDGIPFTSSIKTDMEIWHWVECDASFAASTFFYAIPGATHNRTPEPEEAKIGILPVPPPLPPFKIEGALECEQIVVKAINNATANPQTMDSFGRNKWSNESQLWITAKEPGASIDLEIPAPGNAPHRLTLYATRSWDYAIVKFTINGKPAAGEAGTGLDLFSGQTGVAKPTGAIDLGAFEPVDGKFLLHAQITGANEKAAPPKTYFGLDCIVLSPATPPVK